MNDEILKMPVSDLTGVGPKTAERLSARGIETIEDLLYLMPNRYIDRRVVRAISELQPGEQAAVVGRVIDSRSVYFRNKRRRGYEAVIEDGTGALSLKWFRFSSDYIKKICNRNNVLFAAGRIGTFGEIIQIVHPDIMILDDELQGKPLLGILPVYPAIDGVKQGSLRKIIGEALKILGEVKSILPVDIERKRDLPSLSEALRVIHEPEEDLYGLKRRHRHVERLILEEYVLFQAALSLKRSAYKRSRGIGFALHGSLYNRLMDSLGFELTTAQIRVIGEITSDMTSSAPMNRLLQGDVGSGKTICAVAAACIALDNGYQVAFLAPTEILAEQHYLGIYDLFENLGVPVMLIRGSTPGTVRKAMLKMIRDGGHAVVVGTHAMIQENVRFANLGFVVVDEQHRFGVSQRKRLIDKGSMPDVLMLTATPIPRTLSMIVYGDLDVSVIDELPRGRKAVGTKVLEAAKRHEVFNFIDREVRKGGQAYIVCPLIEESGKSDLSSAKVMVTHLQDTVFPQYRIGLLHGAMPMEEKGAVMTAFKHGHVDILVCTTVIEVGIDVPNATVMVIEDAQHFGLSQLHQLRGRVGRGSKRSRCILLTGSKKTDMATRRLRIMEETTDGFKIAEEDMVIRGVGDMLGVKQSGMPQFRVGDVIKDMDLMLEARGLAEELVQKSDSDGLRILEKAIQGRWGDDREASP